jgi:hypothetical protein
MWTTAWASTSEPGHRFEGFCPASTDVTCGFDRYRWGDAVLRHMTLAFFAEAREVLEVDYSFKLPYCHPWPWLCPDVP